MKSSESEKYAEEQRRVNNLMDLMQTEDGYLIGMEQYLDGNLHVDGICRVLSDGTSFVSDRPIREYFPPISLFCAYYPGDGRTFDSDLPVGSTGIYEVIAGELETEIEKRLKRRGANAFFLKVHRPSTYECLNSKVAGDGVVIPQYISRWEFTLMPMRVEDCQNLNPQ
jgi:hypothetical protein